MMTVLFREEVFWRLGEQALNKNHKKSKLKKTYPGWLFVSPFIFGFLTYYLWVLIDSLKYSFSDVKMGAECTTKFIGWGNYIYAFRGHATFLRTMVETIGNMLTNIPIILIFSLFIAVVLNKNIPGRTFFRAVFFIPVVVSVGLLESVDSNNMVMSSLSSMSSIDTGAVNSGVNINDIESILKNLEFSPTIISYISGAVENIMTILNQSGVQIIIFLVGLQSISPSLYEAAQIEGATEWEIFWKITFPVISPMIVVNLFFSVIDALTRSGNSIMSLIRTMGLGAKQTGRASAMAWIYFVAIAFILILVALICKKAVFYSNRED